MRHIYNEGDLEKTHSYRYMQTDEHGGKHKHAQKPAT